MLLKRRLFEIAALQHDLKYRVSPNEIKGFLLRRSILEPVT
jgi:hypothetical protein